MKTANTDVPFRTLTEKFQFVVQEDSTIASDMKELVQCSIPLTESRIEKLRELNPSLARWISDREASYASLQKSFETMREYFGGDERPPAPKLAFKLYAIFGMRILICYTQDVKSPRNFFLRFLNQLYRDRALLASLVGSCWVSQSARFSTELDNQILCFSLRDLDLEEGGNFITVDMTMPPFCSVTFPPLNTWLKCGLGWLFTNHDCCYFHYRCRTPWKADRCH